MTLLSRIYIGSINYDVMADKIEQAFNVFGPVKFVFISTDASSRFLPAFPFPSLAEIPPAFYSAPSPAWPTPPCP